MKSVAELKALGLPHLAWQDILTPTEGAAPIADSDAATLADYFGQFAKLTEDDKGRRKCPGCDKPIEGGLMGAILGGAPHLTTLEWGMANGEAHCAKCGYPFRVYHRNIGGDADPLIEFVQMGLAYHPDGLREREPEAAAASAR